MNYDADDWDDLIKWHEAETYEPPVTHKLSGQDIHDIEDEPFKVPDYPVHTQGVERYIKVVTEAAASVYGSEARDRFIRAVIQAREVTRWTDTKSDLKAMIANAAD